MAEISKEALVAWLTERRQPSHKMLAAGWQKLKRNHRPALGPGPGLVEAFGAMIDELIEEISP